MQPRRLVLTALVAAWAVVAGCMHPIDHHCNGCLVVHHDAPDPPFVSPRSTGLVVLVHGVFGFGPEWAPIRSALARRPDLVWFAFAWPGPFGGTRPNPGETLRWTLQQSLDRLPPSAREVLVLAHSAGAPVAEFAVRRLIVPPGVRVHVALADPARTSLAPYTPVDPISTPFDRDDTPPPRAYSPPMPTGVEVREYRGNGASSRLLGLFERAHPMQNGKPDATKEHVEYLGGKVGHAESVSAAGLPLIEELGRATPVRLDVSATDTSTPR